MKAEANASAFLFGDSVNRVISVGMGAALFLGSAVACVGHTIAWTENRATHEVCRLIRENYYKSGDEKVVEFLDQCDAETTGMSFTKAKAIRNINRKLGAIRSSHLNVFSPSENRWLWEHEGSDTGIRARSIDGELVIISVLAKSPADLAGLKPGDAIVSVNGETPMTAQVAQSTAGHYKIARGKEFLEADLDLADLAEDLSPSLTGVSRDIGLLKIPSFLPQYFEQTQWEKIAKSLPLFRGLIIDLRDNAGGSFPAMLRALSPFRCDKPRIGELWRAPREKSQDKVEMRDELSAESQLSQLAETDAIVLKTFPDYGCFKGPVIVLTDDGTSSVSEIFTHALLKSPRARVWGTPTAGQVVMARWFPVGSLGGGDYAISIPIAGYRAGDGSALELEGISPQKELHYDLAKALRGEDSWIEEAVSALAR